MKVLYNKGLGERGYSLVEVIVAIAIFSIVMIVTVGAITTILDANRKTRSQKLAINNIHSVIESMTRSIRDGSIYHCADVLDPATYIDTAITPQACPVGGGNMLAFTTVGGTRQGYYLMEDMSGLGQIVRYDESGGGTHINMTSDQIDMNILRFRTVSYLDVTLNGQPNVQMVMQGITRSGGADTATEFVLQTFVSERLLDVSVSDLLPEEDLPQNPVCPFNESVPGRQIIHFELGGPYNTLVCCPDPGDPPPSFGYTLGGSDPKKQPIPSPLDVTAGGSYKVTFATFDDHCISPGVCMPWVQNFEVLELDLYDVEGGALLYSSGETLDIPADENDQISVVGSGVSWASGVSSAYIEVVHPSVIPKFQSVVPVCAAFDVGGVIGSIEIYEF